MRVPLLLAALLVSGPALLEVQDPDKPAAAKPALPEVGKPAPAFRLNDHDGRLVEFGGAARTWRVLAFYPKAATPG